MARNGFELNPKDPKGRQSAGNTFLEAYFRYSGNSDHTVIVPNHDEAKWFHNKALRYKSNAKTTAFMLNEWNEGSSKTGTFHVPDPILSQWAWRRMPFGDSNFSLLGIVHTLCSFNVQNALGQFNCAPLRSWDALICTSTCAQQVVKGFLERQEEWLRHHLRAQRFERPQLPVIPLGIHPEEWMPTTKLSRQDIRQKIRHDLNLPMDAELVLLSGRLDLLTKMQPDPILRTLQSLASSSHPKLQLLIYGEAPNETMLNIWKQGARELAPDLIIHWFPGRRIELAGPVRWAADLFLSLPDNPQETFGITPLEAMAAGLPCLVSDWNGYRDTVIQPGEAGDATGFRITTRMQQGLGLEEAIGLLNETIPFGSAVGRLAQGIAVDLDELKAKLVLLLETPSLRDTMGRSGMRRVQEHYAWSAVIEQWRSLVLEVTDRRQLAVMKGICTPPQLPPWMPDTSTGYGAFATEVLSESWKPQPPKADIEQERIRSPFQSWDQTLLNSEGARRRGWWLKQGLTKP